MHVEGLVSGRVELHDGWEADFAGGGGHLYVEVLEVQIPEDVTFYLKRKTC